MIDRVRRYLKTVVVDARPRWQWLLMYLLQGLAYGAIWDLARHF